MVGSYAFITVLILLPAIPFEVFFSCTGEYTHTTISDQLYSAFIQAGVQVFGEHNGIPGWENTTERAIERAILESKLSVIVFSKEHAASRRCLDELVMIMERRSKDRYIVIPVYYHVDRSDVGELTGAYGEAFAELENTVEETMDNRVEGWKIALKEVADIKGMSLNNRYEPQFIQHVVQVTENKLNHQQVLDVAPYSLFFLDSLRWIIRLSFLPEIKKATYASAMWAIKAVKAGASWMWMHYQRIRN